MADKAEDKSIERLYVIPLRKVKFARSSRAAPTAIKHVRDYLTHHMKVAADDIWIDGSLNEYLWSKGKYKIPSRIRVRAVKFEDGVVEVSLPEFAYKKSRRELLKEEREKKTPILRREEAEMPEGEGETGAEDYEVAPTGDGEVKIKKKKAPKTKEDKETEEKEAKPAKKSAEEKPKKEKPAADKKKEKKPAGKTKESSKKSGGKKKPASGKKTGSSKKKTSAKKKKSSGKKK